MSTRVKRAHDSDCSCNSWFYFSILHDEAKQFLLHCNPNSDLQLTLVLQVPEIWPTNISLLPLSGHIGGRLQDAAESGAEYKCWEVAPDFIDAALRCHFTFLIGGLTDCGNL